jgi:glutamyl-tRNA synthetase
MTQDPTAASKPVVTRFAPSPTGFLHIGGARTALFNWLYAKRFGGTFLLRIEDTDRERYTEGAVAAIIDGLQWLGLDWSGEPISQFSRVARHRAVAEEMLARGNAYRCWLSVEELAAMRAEAEAQKKPLIVQSPWRDRDPAEAPAGVKPVIRLKAPRDGSTVVEDRVQGRVEFPNKDLDDLIILRSDGTPTYNLAVVVDDHDMGVTHVIRGVDHLTNAARQTQIYRGMDWDVPVWAHVPLIHGPDGAKLSKRHGALGAEAYRAMGYVPAALRNYLVRLGWSHGNDEIIATEQMIDWFDLDAIGRSAARFDMAKLEDLNAHYIRQTPDDMLLGQMRATIGELEGGPDLDARLGAEGWDRLAQLIGPIKERARTLKDVVTQAQFLVAARPLTLDAKAAKVMDAEAKAALAALIPELNAAGDWTAATLEAAVRAFAEAKGLKLGKIAQPLRVALTGSTVSPPVFDVMAALGREEGLARLSDQA